MTTLPPSYTTLGQGYPTHPHTTHARTDINAMQTAYTPVQTQLRTLNTRYIHLRTEYESVHRIRERARRKGQSVQSVADNQCASIRDGPFHRRAAQGVEDVMRDIASNDDTARQNMTIHDNHVMTIQISTRRSRRRTQSCMESVMRRPSRCETLCISTKRTRRGTTNYRPITGHCCRCTKRQPMKRAWETPMRRRQ